MKLIKYRLNEITNNMYDNISKIPYQDMRKITVNILNSTFLVKDSIISRIKENV